MARQPTPQQVYERLLDAYGEQIANAFRAAVEDLASGADLRRMEAALRRGDLTAAISALNLEPAAYDRVLETIRQAYVEGGEATTALLPRRDPSGAALVFRFNVRNLGAEQWLRDHATTLVRQIADDQRTSVRNALVNGMEQGRNPRSVALEIIGRVDRRTGQRVGGIIGLTSTQEEYVRNARAELESGDPEQMRAYLQRARRDRRFDRSIERAIREERPLEAETVRKATAAYTGRLQALRGEMLGRTEALRALNAARYESLEQAVASGKLTRSQIQVAWRSAHDSRVRTTHAVLDGKKTRLGEPFRSPSGAMMRFPGDTSLGAPASEVIGCRCYLAPVVDWTAGVT